jgi:hypothetical protein
MPEKRRAVEVEELMTRALAEIFVVNIIPTLREHGMPVALLEPHGLGESEFL